jgi:predicted phage-related endonuclease
MLATVDGLVDGPDDGVLEVKTAGRSHGWGEPDDEDIPADYALQGMHYMIVTGRRVCWFAALIGGSDFRIRRMVWDDELAAMVIDAEKRFWEENVLAKNPPLAETVDEARKKWPRSSGKPAVFASKEIVEACSILGRDKAEIKRLEEQVDMRQALIMDFMGGAEELQDERTVIATWKETKPSMKFDEKAFSAAHPDIHAKFLRAKDGNRRFLLKSRKEV